ncbi:MAG TPA: rhodanese-like domain-containing protein [Chloroflexaceae bacterium]|nr:rhodanese-like domain-containing protein [Chloroflexaceae bacterium]
MLLKYFYDETLAQASYLIGCAATGEALVVDPMRDVEPYLEAAARAGMRIAHVAETHIHADFVSGVRELAARTGARMYLSDMGDAAWKYAFPELERAALVRDGDCWMVGNIKVEVVATPGHTPEHIAFMITDTAGADAPIGICTGDFLFVGDVGRPDLLEEAAGLVGTKEAGARAQFRTVERFRAMPDYLQVWPAHGAGSACGKALGAIPSTTLGYEKRFNPAFQIAGEEPFVRWLTSGQPEPPRYFARMKQVNKAGPALLSELAAPAEVGRAAVEAARAAGALVVDLRPQAEFAAGHLPGSLSVPMTAAMYSTYVGWFVDYERPTYLVLPDGADLDQILRTLRAIGVDDIPRFLPAAALGDGLATLPTAGLDDVATALAGGEAQILDVRGQGEYDALHLPGALHIPLGFLPRRLDAIPRDRPVVVHCASGYRSHIAASLLRRLGLANVATLVDPRGRWRDLAAAEAVA